jgi:hydrogenase expression/formation protein HypD
MRAILASPDNQVQAFLAAGHVCAVSGYEEYLSLADEFRVPIVVTGFEPVDILQGVLLAIRQLENGECSVENQYSRVVARGGNAPARALLDEVFQRIDRSWRGIGTLPESGYRLAEPYAAFDAELLFGGAMPPAPESPDCIAGLVLQGRARPHSCPAFGSRCTPDHPLGAPMVSSEGACAAYHRYHKRRPLPHTKETTV